MRDNSLMSYASKHITTKASPRYTRSRGKRGSTQNSSCEKMNKGDLIQSKVFITTGSSENPNEELSFEDLRATQYES